MDRKEAILRIKDHMEHHGIGKYPHLKLKEALDMAITALDTPNSEKPPCYLPEKDNPYPLCEGRGMKACAHCCLWENYDPEEDESRVNQPLTMRQLREMDGDPVWVKCLKQSKYVDPPVRWRILEKSIMGTFGVWNGESGLIERNYGTDWLAYRRQPEGEV